MKKFKELNKIDLGIPIKDTVKSIHDLIYKNCQTLPALDFARD